MPGGQPPGGFSGQGSDVMTVMAEFSGTIVAETTKKPLRTPVNIDAVTNEAYYDMNDNYKFQLDGLHAVSASDGQFSMRAPVGTYQVTFSASSYGNTQTLTVPPQGLKQATIVVSHAGQLPWIPMDR